MANKKVEARKIKEVRVNNTAFNADHYAGWTESKFVEDQLASVPDSYGDDKKKTDFLKSVYAKLNPAKSDEKQAEKVK